MPPAKKDKPAPAEELDFEQALAELEGLVEELEGGELALEKSLAAFERGVALTRRCQSALRAAEQKVEILVKESGAERTAPFEPEQ